MFHHNSQQTLPFAQAGKTAVVGEPVATLRSSAIRGGSYLHEYKKISAGLHMATHPAINTELAINSRSASLATKPVSKIESENPLTDIFRDELVEHNTYHQNDEPKDK